MILRRPYPDVEVPDVGFSDFVFANQRRGVTSLIEAGRKRASGSAS